MSDLVELFIDGHRVVLPSQFSTTITEEHPLFSKRGQYTLDLELSLLHPVNAVVYKHINRKANTIPVPENRVALLLVRNRVFLNGTEVVLDINDTSVKIQLVSGNSELNYLGSDVLIRNLDLGTRSGFTPLGNRENLSKTYPEVDWQLLPFMTNDNNWIGNSYIYISTALGVMEPGLTENLSYWGCYKPNTRMAEGYGNEPYYVNIRPQPYLCAIIRKIIVALGYTLESNVLAEDYYFSRLYIVNGYDTTKFAKTLPNWTVTEFFNQLEALFDVTVVVNNKNKTVKILFNFQFEDGTKTKLQVVDEYACDVSSPISVSKKSKNVAYNLGTEEYYKLHRLPAITKEKAIATILSTSSPIDDLMTKIANASDANRFKKLFSGANAQFIAFTEAGSTIAKKVDSFCDLVNDTTRLDEVDLTLKMIPAAFKTIELETDIVLAGGSRKNYMMQFPVVDVYDPFIFSDQAAQASVYTLQGLTVDGASNNENVSDIMRLAFYDGRHEVDVIGPNWEDNTLTFDNIPISFVEDVPEYAGQLGRDKRFMNRNNPLRLKWLNDNIYSQFFNINEKKPYKFSFLEKQKIDITSPFIIDNKKYLCSKIERKITEGGIASLVSGTFFQLD